MIIDTTYLLPLSRISINADLLQAISEKRVTKNLTFKDLTVSLISIFELQAKARKLKVNPDHVSEAISLIAKNFRLESFYSPDLVKKSFELKTIFSDYIDCVIIATAISLKEDLISEELKILKKKRILQEQFDVQVSNYAELIQK